MSGASGAAGFNLSDWALRHKSLVVYLMIVSAIAGLYSYQKLGREEDPPFTIKVMVVRALWPGATTADTLKQVTDRIEKKLEELPYLDYVRSYTKPGDALVYVTLLDSTPAALVPDLWYQVRKKIGDIRSQLPEGIQGPFFNDEFGDTYSVIYAFTSDGFGPREVRDQLELVRTQLLRVKDVAKVDFIGTQDEKIYLEFSTQQMAALGIDASSLMDSLQAQNAIVPSGVLEEGQERISVRVSGSFDSEESLKSINFQAGNRFYRLSDIATVRRGYVDPPQPMFRYNGEPATGLAISMSQGGDVLALGDAIERAMEEVTRNLPIGIEPHLVSNQPHVVEEAVGEFTKTLWEAIAIVLGVSFLALGWRPGVVVAVAIPLVLAVTFAAMLYFGISLQRISLGALIIALGLLVDDAMIAVEMMISKLEEGADKITAATYAYTVTAFPMLTGTLVTIIGFIPVGFAKSSAGEYCFTLFAVVGIALIVSWVVAVLFTPLTGVFILPDKITGHHHAAPGTSLFGRVLDRALRAKWLVLAGTVAVFVLSLVGMRFVQQQFFPASDRPELLINVTLPQTASIHATEQTVERIEAILKADPDVDYWTFYVGQGAVRFYLPLDAQLANTFFAQAVVVTKGFKQRPGVQARIEAAVATGFEDAMIRVSPLELGPPVGWPLKFRVSGDDAASVRERALEFAGVMGANPNVTNINFDWSELSKVVKVDIDQDRARAVGLTSRQIASNINSVLSGTTITQVRDHTYLVDVVTRAVEGERAKLDTLRSLRLATPSGGNVPLAQVATLSYTLEPPLVWRRSRLPTVTVQADVVPGVEAMTVVRQLGAAIDKFRTTLPPGYSVTAGGTVEDSAKAQASIFAVFPIMLLMMTTILMIQLRSFQKLVMVLLTAPLALIGVVASLLLFRIPMGFVAILGVISLIGMVIRNSVILIEQIDMHINDGEPPWEAVISATEHRLRPILLTAAAAILGMVPIAGTVFWGPMAFAVIGGLMVATLLTLVFLPALYVAWFRIPPPGSRPEATAHASAAHVSAAPSAA
ncbi:MAG: efflux RND transporter permease subunit [Hyphomicrobium sp.]|jgi:multidrug efflux pump subunit AcrB|uniref:efflux RND transporter permease subunit n=2 Tax=Hyphomicrobium TaxID=81 RepID=UPI0025C0ADAA|nr:efflux RND transporter permease subunit [Hyphomicrobium sp.]MBX9862723.1 efflux RND transporter permease subunit [Hyphomicrobium sp.]